MRIRNRYYYCAAFISKQGQSLTNHRKDAENFIFSHFIKEACDAWVNAIKLQGYLFSKHLLVSSKILHERRKKKKLCVAVKGEL